MLETEIAAESNPAAKTAKEERIKAWKLTAARYESEPETHEGRKELAERQGGRGTSQYIDGKIS